MKETYKQKRKIIFWDWNGTLLNDVHICINIINNLLSKRNLPQVNLQRYREVFTFPVIDYYRELGFDFNSEPFDIPAKEFIDQYSAGLKSAGLHDYSYDTLKHFKNRGYEQYILSAMEHKMLNEIVEDKGIHELFDGIAGIKDIYAKSKLHIVEELYNGLNAKANDVVFVGDTLHDHEIADHFGFYSILLTHGHQSKERLESTKAVIENDFSNIKNIIDDIFIKIIN